MNGHDFNDEENDEGNEFLAGRNEGRNHFNNGNNEERNGLNESQGGRSQYNHILYVENFSNKKKQNNI